MAEFVRDTFAGSNWKTLDARTGEAGAVWTAHPAMAASNGRMYIYGGRIHAGSTAAGGSTYATLYTASGVPAGADYTVAADMVLYSNVPSLNLGVAGRVSTSADTYYATYYEDDQLVLIKRVAGVTTALGWWVSSLTYGGTVYRLGLDLAGTTIRALVDDVTRITVTDGDITAAGRVGLRSIGVENPDEGVQLDNLVATDGSAVARPAAQVVGIVGL